MDKQKNKFSFVDILFLIILPVLLIFGILFSNIYSCSNKINKNSDSVSITENIDVLRSINRANQNPNSYVNPSIYNKYIYIDNTITPWDFYSALDYFMQVNLNNSIVEGDFALYPLYAYYFDDEPSVIYTWFITYYVVDDAHIIMLQNINLSTFEGGGIYFNFYWDAINGLDSSPIPSFINNDLMDRVSAISVSTISVYDMTFTVGASNYNLYNFFSFEPFANECPSVPSGPTYEMAPSSLVNDIPINVEFPSGIHNNKNVSPVLTYPSVVGKYYGSIYGNSLSVVGSQNESLYDYKADIYINSSLRPKQQVFGFDDFISYYDTYDYLFTGFDIVLQTMWGQLPIYYKITTNDFGFAYDVSRLLNESNTIDDYFNLSFTSDVEERFLDYVHINIQFYFNADTNYDTKYFNVNEEYELEGLIPNTYYNGEYIQAEFGSVRYDADSFITNDEVVANGAYQTLRNYRIATSNVLNRIEQAYSDEYEQGYNEGYSAGTIDAGGDNALGPVFAWLSSASSIIANIFSIQIFPYITLGMLLLFPLVVFVIVWILKLFFGG